MKISHLFEELTDKHVTFCFGRMNPPTAGHAKVFDTMSNVGGDMKIFLSKTQKPKTDPLTFSQKVEFVRRIHPNYAGDVVDDPNIKTAWQAASYLYDQGYSHATFVGGPERESMYESLKKYNGEEGPHGYYKFETFDFENSGEREDGAEGVKGISGTLARKDAAEGNLNKFIQHTGAGEAGEDLFKATREGMGLPAEPEEKKSVEERYQIKLKQLVEGDLVVTSGGVRGTVIDLIKDKIMQTDDYEQISQWLKVIVGKSIKPRGDKRYTITSEDVVEAIQQFKEACKCKRKSS
jgi:hypothetical protein